MLSVGRRASGSLSRRVALCVEQALQNSWEKRGCDLPVNARLVSSARELRPPMPQQRRRPPPPPPASRSSKPLYGRIDITNHPERPILEMLKAEIDNTRKIQKFFMKDPPPPFKLKVEPGKMEVYMQRRYGIEEIHCTTHIVPRADRKKVDSQDEVQDPKRDLCLELRISITKGGLQAMEINCQLYKNKYSINHIHFCENKASKEQGWYIPYGKRISQKLKDEFHQFLAVRGFDDVLAKYEYDYMSDKDFRDRLLSFERIEAVIKVGAN